MVNFLVLSSYNRMHNDRVTNEFLSPSFLITLLEKQRFGVEYQPIVELASQENFAFESLARFFDNENFPVRPDLVYASLHESPLSLFQVEYQQKKLQLSHAPNIDKLFVGNVFVFPF